MAERLARRVARAARHPAASRTLLLDVDGTLAPIAPTPGEARVPAATLACLEELISRGWEVAVVSGRPASQVRALVPLRGAHVFGSHGLEGRWPGSPRVRIEARARRTVRALTAGAGRLAARTPGVRLETKPAGLAFHDRGVPRSSLVDWHRKLRTWLDTQDLDGLERLSGLRVVELRPRGANKGRVVRNLPRRRGAPRPDRSLVAIGDDQTDEDLFREIKGIGLAVRVGRPGRRSAAPERLPSPHAVQRFLEHLSV